MAISRLSLCHQWNTGGYDPVEPPLDPDTATQQSMASRRLN
jgi:putative component of membrane protein insertase Oxa1/YidC/SpoIIIJ protein YidD